MPQEASLSAPEGFSGKDDRFKKFGSFFFVGPFGHPKNGLVVYFHMNLGLHHQVLLCYRLRSLCCVFAIWTGGSFCL